MARLELAHLAMDAADILIFKDRDNLAKMKAALIEQNRELGNSALGFIYNGRFHLKEGAKKAPPFEERKLLHPSLHAEGDAFMAEDRKVGEDHSRIMHGLSVLLRGCHSLQDVRDSFPDFVCELLPDLKDRSRTREEAWTIQGRELMLDQFNKLRELMFFYYSNRILY